MSILDIRVLGDPILRQATTKLDAITGEHRRLIDDMFETMYVAKGIGLAAPQIGRTERICVVDVDGATYALVNPEVVTSDGKARAEEGCLSIPEIYGDVERPARAVVRALDGDGNPFEVEADGLLARCFQHEIDHLDGKLFIDYLSFLKRKSAMAKWELQKERYPGFIRHLTPDEIRRIHHDEDL